MAHICRLRTARLLVFVSLSFAFVTAVPAATQSTGTTQPTTATQPPAPAQRSTQANEQQTFSQDELDALLAPIALYPDGLLTQVLMAATYPLEVVHADRFLKQNRSLHGTALEDTVAEKNWDPSVQSLTAYPKVLATMSDKLEWTERLGNAVLEDQARVMDTVQGLRKRAEAAGNLKSTSEQSVVHEKKSIIIEPSQKGVVYVPYYDSTVVYGGVCGRVLPLLRPLLRRHLSQRFVQRVVLDLAQPLGVGAPTGTIAGSRWQPAISAS